MDSYSRLLEHFWTLHSHERVYQGPRASGSWTPAIYCHSQEQCDLAEHSKERLQEKKGRPLITEIQPNNTFLEAEPEHQKHMLRSRTDVFETFKLGDRALVKSHAAALINAYLGGKCHGVRTWEETEEAIMDLELSLEQLKSLGLEVLHSEVYLMPRFGQTKLSPEAAATMDRQLRLRSERLLRKKDKASITEEQRRQAQLYQQYMEAKAKQRQETEERLAKEAGKAANQKAANQQKAAEPKHADGNRESVSQRGDDESLQKEAQIAKDAAAQNKKETTVHNPADVHRVPDNKAKEEEGVVDNPHDLSQADGDGEACAVEGIQVHADDQYINSNAHEHNSRSHNPTPVHTDANRPPIQRAHDEL